MYSALKYQGKPLYQYAREGIEVPRESRPITVYELKLIRFEGDEVELEVHASKGTYIRTIVDDLGERLGCGAHVTMLRRLAVAGYPAERMLTLEQLQCILDNCKANDVSPRLELDPLLLPMDTAVQGLPEINLSELVAGYLLQGQAVQVAGAPLEGFVRLTVGPEHRFVGVGEIDDDGKVAPRRLVR
jgi:tRNA pseudouridine55 synthase